jgi:hypothetical protein
VVDVRQYRRRRRGAQRRRTLFISRRDAARSVASAQAQSRQIRCALIAPRRSSFYSKGQLLRPAQNCAKHYGYGITINKIVRLDPNEFVEQEVSKVLPEWHKDIVGTHTLNIADDLTVIDCLMKRRKI